MKRSARLDQIAALSSGFENKAGAQLAAAQALLDQSRRQLDQLLLYREEYRQRLRDRMQAAISAREMRDYRFFFDSLEEAIRQQQALVDSREREREHAHAQWLEKRRDVKKATQAADNVRRQERLEAERREQKELDEGNQLRALQSAMSLPLGGQGA